jgi:hypothetical protein
MSTLNPFSWWLLAVSFLLIDGLLFVLGYWCGGLRRPLVAIADAEVAPELAGDHGMADDGAAQSVEPARLQNLESRLLKLESALRRVEHQPRYDAAPLQEGGASMEVAARLARKGSSVEELMSVCNLGRGEAELIRVLYGGGRAA